MKIPVASLIPQGIQKLAKDCNVTSGRVVAIAFNNRGHIIAIETNRQVMDQPNIGYSLHAESFLVQKLEKINAGARFKSVNIFVIRLADYGLTMARPCKHCYRSIKKAGYINKIYYTDWSGEIAEYRDKVVPNKQNRKNKSFIKKIIKNKDERAIQWLTK